MVGGPGWSRSSVPAPAHWAAHWEPCTGLVFGVDAHSLARAVSTCFYELPHAGWWLRAPRPRPSGGGVTVGITAGCTSPSCPQGHSWDTKG